MSETITTAVCPEPGIYKGIDDREYRKWPAASPSDAKSALVSMMDYAHSRTERREETDAMRLGSLCHAAVMEPDTMLRKFALWEGERRAGNEWKDFAKANAGKILVTKAQLEIAGKVRDRCNRHPAIRRIMAKVQDAEVSLRWDHKCERSAGMIACKGRPDMLMPGRIPDVKTTNSLADKSRASIIASKGYDVSMAAYQIGVKEVIGEVWQPVLIWICTKPPFDAIVRFLEDDWIGRGQDLWIDAIENIAIAKHTNKYPGKDDQEAPEIMPSYVDDDTGSLGLVGLFEESED